MCQRERERALTRGDIDERKVRDGRKGKFRLGLRLYRLSWWRVLIFV